jgi:hypothetical protein
LSNLLIIDVQNTYAVWITNTNILNDIPILAKQYSNIIYLWDNVSGQELYDEIPDDWMISDDEESSNTFYDSVNKLIEKQYGFFRDLMDSSKLNISDEDIISLGQFMVKEKLTDMREIYDDKQLEKKFNNRFKNTNIKEINFNDYNFTFPSDLAEELKQHSSYVLVGGGLDECLKEVSLLLDILEITYSIEKSCCY